MPVFCKSMILYQLPDCPIFVLASSLPSADVITFTHIHGRHIHSYSLLQASLPSADVITFTSNPWQAYTFIFPSAGKPAFG
jgi:hypothetical protein